MIIEQLILYIVIGVALASLWAMRRGYKARSDTLLVVGHDTTDTLLVAALIVLLWPFILILTPVMVMYEAGKSFANRTRK